MELLDGDHSLNIMLQDSVKICLLGAKVEENHFACSSQFDKFINQTAAELDSKSNELENVDFVGLRICIKEDKCGKQSFFSLKPEYFERLYEMYAGSTFEHLYSIFSTFVWLARSQLDVFCSVNFASNVTKSKFYKKRFSEPERC